MAEPLPEKIFGLLSMAMTERKVLGVELVDDTLRRDVMQVTVNFFNHRYLGLTSNEQDTRRELKKRAFDFLIEKYWRASRVSETNEGNCIDRTFFRHGGTKNRTFGAYCTNRHTRATGSLARSGTLPLSATQNAYYKQLRQIIPSISGL